MKKKQLSPGQLADLLAELVCTETSLRRAARRLGRLYDEAVAPSGINATQAGLLAQIAGDRRHTVVPFERTEFDISDLRIEVSTANIKKGLSLQQWL